MDALAKHFPVLYMGTLGPADAEVIPIDIAAIKETFAHVCRPDMWPFLLEPPAALHAVRDLMDHESLCRSLTGFLQMHEPCIIPRPCGKHRVLLYLFSGRRRRGATQYYLDALSAKQDALVMHVIFIDIIIDPILGDVTKQETCDYWLDAIRCGWVIAMLAGTPCESWSRARARSVPLEPASHDHGLPSRRGPRIIRDVQRLWGFDSVTLKEKRQLCVGNMLLGFAILAFMDLLLTDGGMPSSSILRSRLMCLQQHPCGWNFPT